MNENTKVITNFENSQLSVAAHYGGCQLFGREFVAAYPKADENGLYRSALIRADALKDFKRLRKAGKSFDDALREIAKHSVG
jgi:hypothetical protein